MSRIVIDARIINSSTGTYVERLLYYLQLIDKKNEYIVLIPTKDRNFWKPTSKKWSVKFCDIPNYSVSEQTKFKKFLEDLSPDLVHFCMPQQPMFYSGKKVTTFHDLTLLKVYNSDKNYFVFKAKQSVGRVLFKKVAYDSQAIITPTEYTKNDLIEFAKINPNKITVTYEGADIGIYPIEPIKLPFKKFILNVGRHSDYKNNVRLAEAHQILLKKYPKLGLVFVNRPDEATITNENLFRDRGYKNIYFSGEVSKGVRDYLYTNATVYATLSLNEGFGLTGLEAMGFGLPVLSSDATCLPEVYADGATYCDPLDISDIVDKLNALLSDEKLRKDMVKRGKARHATFSWERMAKQTLEVYQSVLDK